jgi:hypothetical protein
VTVVEKTGTAREDRDLRRGEERREGRRREAM